MQSQKSFFRVQIIQNDGPLEENVFRTIPIISILPTCIFRHI